MLNASDSTSIKVVRDEIKTFASARTLFAAPIKMVVLDECDYLSNDAQDALRRVIEKHTATCRFVLICNQAGKVRPAIRSRCTRFRFGPLPDAHISARLRAVVEAEGCAADDAGINAVVALAHGDMRRALNITQAVHMGREDGSITEAGVYAATGQPHPRRVEEMLRALLTRSFADAFAFVQGVIEDDGLAVTDIVTQLGGALKRLHLSPSLRCMTLTALATAEHRLNAGTDEKLQLGGLVGLFQGLRAQMGSEIKGL